jgi:DNA-binding transcriptional LysR family regulator
LSRSEEGEPVRGAELRVLLANEPRSYRESVAAVFRQLHPGLEVKVVEPEALESNVARFDPDVAICSHVTGAVRERVPVWVELYPEHAAHSVASEGGRRTEFAEIQLLDLIGILDRAADRVGPV